MQLHWLHTPCTYMSVLAHDIWCEAAMPVVCKGLQGSPKAENTARIRYSVRSRSPAQQAEEVTVMKCQTRMMHVYLACYNSW